MNLNEKYSDLESIEGIVSEDGSIVDVIVLVQLLQLVLPQEVLHLTADGHLK